MDMRSIVDAELIRGLVSRNITCPKTGKVLDMRTCLVIRDGDGDPIGVLVPSAGEDEALKQRIIDKSWTLDECKKS